uniref:hypothetical protein n=1 Tax=Pseudonocardia sp. CA-138482 TaxID=3240023 RepID=UPI003F4935B8
MALIVSTCVLCGQTDDHPKDVVAMPGDLTARYHHDCHAAAEPPCESCRWLVAHKGDLKGTDWREQIGSLHAAMPGEHLELHPHERAVVDSHLGGTRP